MDQASVSTTPRQSAKIGQEIGRAARKPALAGFAFPSAGKAPVSRFGEIGRSAPADE